MKSQVMKLAHQLKGKFQNFSQAMKAAWAIVKMSLQRTVDLTFAKADGEIRHAVGIATGDLSTIEKGYVRFLERTDVGYGQWRSFRIERMIF